MSYDPTKPYYRCTIIRGKTQREMDDMLPFYAECVYLLCPTPRAEFNDAFRDAVAKKLYGDEYGKLSTRHQPTVCNHVTEIAGKLLGLYWEDESGYVRCSDSCVRLLETNDQPAFFKNLCYNFQFPNATQRMATARERIRDGIRLRPFHFLVALLKMAQEKDVSLSEDDLGFYVLSAPDVLMGRATVKEVFATIAKEKKSGLVRTIPTIPGKASSWSRQHIHETIGLLELANLVRVSSRRVVLNMAEHESIDLFLESPTDLGFDFSRYDLDRDKKAIEADWGRYYGSFHVPNVKALDTPTDALMVSFAPEEPAPSDTGGGEESEKAEDADESEPGSKTELGERGERLVFEMEKRRVGRTHPKLVNKVLSVGHQKGLGYDVSSVEAGEAAENTEFEEYQRMIEVKSTKRSTKPDFDSPSWQDSVTMSRKEWITAQQYPDRFAIYRVYFTSEGTFVYKIMNPEAKSRKGLLSVKPASYSVSFGKEALDCEYKTQEG